MPTTSWRAWFKSWRNWRQSMTAIPLPEVLARLPAGWGRVQQAAEGPAIIITGVAEDSRRVQPGHLFLARRGRGTDGHRYIPAALQAGAVAVAGELAADALPAPLPEGVPYLQIAEGRTAFAL